MRPAYLGLALALGLIGFAAVEITGCVIGVPTSITDYLWLDAAAYGLAAALLAVVFFGGFRRSRPVGAFLLVLGFVLLFAPLAAALGAAAELTLDGRWGEASTVGAAFRVAQIRLISALTLDVGVVAVPLGIVAAGLLAWQARRSGRR
ncbi:MAG: hypothetical protein K0A98_00035 [Trueperaceae bacterium]|nr:hypothetical protein [Trueperaceae bacterium]